MLTRYLGRPICLNAGFSLHFSFKCTKKGPNSASFYWKSQKRGKSWTCSTLSSLTFADRSVLLHLIGIGKHTIGEIKKFIIHKIEQNRSVCPPLFLRLSKKMQKLRLFSCISMRNEGKTRAASISGTFTSKQAIRSCL